LDEALAALRAAKPEHAVTLCDELLNAYPDAVRVLKLRGQALEALGDFDTAIKDDERVLEILPTDVDAAMTYAKLLSRLGRKEEAALVAQGVLDWSPADVEAQRIATEGAVILAHANGLSSGRLAAAKAQFGVGRTTLALNTVRKVLTQAPHRSDARITLAEFLWRAGQTIQVAELCQNILDEQPDCLVAHAILAQVWQVGEANAPALQLVHMRAVDGFDPDHRLVQEALPGQRVFAVSDVLAVPPVVGFAAEDVADVSDEPDHEDFIDRLMVDSRDLPLSPTSAAPMPGYVAASVGEGEGEVLPVSRLSWQHADAAQAIGARPAAEATDAEDWVRAVREKAHAQAAGASAAVFEGDSAGFETADDGDGDDNRDAQLRQGSGSDSSNTAVVTDVEDWVSAEKQTAAPTVPKAATKFVPASAARSSARAGIGGGGLELARSAIKQNHWMEAEAQYRKLIESSKHIDDVLTDVMALAARQPRRAWFVLLGMAYTSKGKIDAALEAYRKAEAYED
jgi:tetratricopeptide (TPR) repeat protein